MIHSCSQLINKRRKKYTQSRTQQMYSKWKYFIFIRNRCFLRL